MEKKPVLFEDKKVFLIRSSLKINSIRKKKYSFKFSIRRGYYLDYFPRKLTMSEYYTNMSMELEQQINLLAVLNVPELFFRVLKNVKLTSQPVCFHEGECDCELLYSLFSLETTCKAFYELANFYMKEKYQEDIHNTRPILMGLFPLYDGFLLTRYENSISDYLCQYKPAWLPEALKKSMRRGDLEAMKFLWGYLADTFSDNTICEILVKKGYYQCFNYAMNVGMPINSQLCTIAAANGHLDCLMLAHEQGCLWDEDTCIEAARFGQLKCLQYAHENGCPWDLRILEVTLKGTPCHEYARANGCEAADVSDHSLAKIMINLALEDMDLEEGERVEEIMYDNE